MSATCYLEREAAAALRAADVLDFGRYVAHVIVIAIGGLQHAKAAAGVLSAALARVRQRAQTGEHAHLAQPRLTRFLARAEQHALAAQLLVGDAQAERCLLALLHADGSRARAQLHHALEVTRALVHGPRKQQQIVEQIHPCGSAVRVALPAALEQRLAHETSLNVREEIERHVLYLR